VIVDEVTAVEFSACETVVGYGTSRKRVNKDEIISFFIIISPLDLIYLTLY